MSYTSSTFKIAVELLKKKALDVLVWVLRKKTQSSKRFFTSMNLKIVGNPTARILWSFSNVLNNLLKIKEFVRKFMPVPVVSLVFVRFRY